MTRVVVQGGKVVDPASGIEADRDLLIEDGMIRAMEKPGGFGKLDSTTELDAKGRLVLPGAIDLHVHFRDPGYEWKETIATGSQAAVLGGFTTVCCMPNTAPVNDCREVTEYMLSRASEARAARVLPIGSVSIGLLGKEMAPLTELAQAGCVAFSDDGEPVWDAGLMRRALEWCLSLGIPIACHEEDKQLSCGGCMNESPLSLRKGLKGWHSVAEEVMIARDIEIARAFKGKIHICHVSTARGVELIRRAKSDGVLVTCEVTPHHLVLTEDAVGEYDTHAKMSPPLRARSDVEGLIAGLRDGTVDAVASDHAPHDRDSKNVEFGKAAFGILGLQTTMPLLMELVREGKIPLSRAIGAVSSGPAKSFGLTGGTLAVGAAADLMIFDSEREWTFGEESSRSKSVNSPFWGKKMKGQAQTVMVGGNVVVADGRLISEQAKR